MRKEIRKLIKESLYDSMERNLTLPSGKVLPNFRGIVINLTSGVENAKQVFSILQMIDEYSLLDDSKTIIKHRIESLSTRLLIVRLYFTDKEVADAFHVAISNHPDIKSAYSRGPGIKLTPMTSGSDWHCLSFYITK